MKFTTILLLTIGCLAVPVREDIKKSELKRCECIGKGACGDIEKCFDPTTNTWYAVKAQKVDHSLNSIAEKEIEILKILAEKQVPGIAGLKFIDRSELKNGGEKIYLGFDLFKKGDLANYIWELNGKAKEEAKKLTEKIALHLIVGLTNIQRAGILHLDVKPENILVDNNDIPHYADFGLSEEYKHENQKGKLMGTPGFMDKQVVRDETFSRKTDSWALGILLIELFKGGDYRSHKSQTYGMNEKSIDKIIADVQKLNINQLPLYPTHSRINFPDIIQNKFLNSNDAERKTAGDVVEEIKRMNPGLLGEKIIDEKTYYTFVKHATQPQVGNPHQTIHKSIYPAIYQGTRNITPQANGHNQGRYRNFMDKVAPTQKPNFLGPTYTNLKPAPQANGHNQGRYINSMNKVAPTQKPNFLGPTYTNHGAQKDQHLTPEQKKNCDYGKSSFISIQVLKRN